jgi:hypothetical protein
MPVKKQQQSSFFYAIGGYRASPYKTIQHMKYAFLFLACFICSTAAMYAQDTYVIHQQNDLKIKFSNDSISATYRNKPLPVNSIRELDSCLKKIIQDPVLPLILVESPDGTDSEKLRALSTVLVQCHCPIIMSSGMQYIIRSQPVLPMPDTIHVH